MLIPKSKKWFDYGSRKVSGHCIFSYDSILLTINFAPIAAFAIVSYTIPATVFRMYEGEGRLFTGVTV